LLWNHLTAKLVSFVREVRYAVFREQWHVGSSDPPLAKNVVPGS